MNYLSKTYRLDEEVVGAIEQAKAGGTSPNRFLRELMGLSGNGAARETEAPVPVAVEQKRSVPTLRDIRERLGEHERVEPVDNRPKNCRCRHCGRGFAGPRFATICSECKSAGHTLAPNECPVCNEAGAL